MDSKLVAAHHETASLTAQRIMDYRPEAAVTSNVGSTTWSVQLSMSPREVITAVGGEAMVAISVNGELRYSKRASELTRGTLATELVMIALGHRSIPVVSRAQSERAITLAEELALVQFSLGMRRLIRNGFPALWGDDDEHDDAERWATIVEAADAEHGSPLGYMRAEENAFVPLAILDVFYDRYYEVSGGLMAQFSHTTSRPPVAELGGA